MKVIVVLTLSLLFSSCAAHQYGKLLGVFENDCVYLGPEKELYCPLEGCPKCAPQKYYRKRKRNIRGDKKRVIIIPTTETSNEDKSC